MRRYRPTQTLGNRSAFATETWKTKPSLWMGNLYTPKHTSTAKHMFIARSHDKGTRRRNKDASASMKVLVCGGHVDVVYDNPLPHLEPAANTMLHVWTSCAAWLEHYA